MCKEEGPGYRLVLIHQCVHLFLLQHRATWSLTPKESAHLSHPLNCMSTLCLSWSQFPDPKERILALLLKPDLLPHISEWKVKLMSIISVLQIISVGSPQHKNPPDSELVRRFSILDIGRECHWKILSMDLIKKKKKSCILENWLEKDKRIGYRDKRPVWMSYNSAEVDLGRERWLPPGWKIIKKKRSCYMGLCCVAVLCYAVYASIHEATDSTTFWKFQSPESYNSLDWE